MMVAASTGSGSRASQPVGATSASASKPAVMMLARGVFAPAWKLTAEREMEPVTGKPPDSALATLAAPRPSSSRLVCSFSPRFCARVCAADMLIKKTMKAISSPGDSRVRQWALEVARFRPGKPLGTWPVVCTPMLSRPQYVTRTMPASTSAIGARRAPTSAATLLRPQRCSRRDR
ncbi:hypothetical protein D3C81_770910 [compost metagenome]